jgi:hypothetical protein
VLPVSHWISILGVALVTTAGFFVVICIAAAVGGRASNPYVGILAFLAIPAVLFAGLALIPLGILLARRTRPGLRF